MTLVCTLEYLHDNPVRDADGLYARILANESYRLVQNGPSSSER